MSDTGNFGSQKVDLLEDAANNYKRLSKRLDHLEADLSQFRSSGEILKDLGHSFVVLSHEFSSFKQACCDHFEMTNKRWLEHHHKFGDSEAKLGTADRKTSDLQGHLEEHAKQMAQAVILLDRKIGESRASFVSTSEFRALQQDLKNSAIEVQAAYGSIRAQLANLTKDKERLEVQISDIEKISAIRHEDLGSMHRSFMKDCVSTAQAVVDCQRDIDAKFLAHTKKSEKDLDIVKQELQGSPSSLESAKEQLLQKLKSVEMDAANSLLRSKNSDSQIIILQKKIENIQLVLKNIELR